MPSESSERLNALELRTISAHAVSRSYPKNTVVVSEGDATNSLYVVLEGRVKIFLADATGREIVLGEAGPAFAFHLVQNLIARVRVLTDNVKSLALMDVYGRVARVLLELAHEENGQLVISEKPTQIELAGRIGASREMVSRILKDLSSGGFIRTEGKSMVIARTLPKQW